MIWAALCALSIAILGVVPVSGLSIRTGKEWLVELVLLGIIGACIQTRWLRYFFWWSIVVYASRYNQQAYLAMMTLTLYIVAWEGLAHKICVDKLGWLISGIRIITLVQLAWMSLQYFNLDPLFRNAYPTSDVITVGFLTNTTLAGAFLAIVTPFFAVGRWRIVLPLLLFFAFVTQSTGAILAMTIVMGWCLWRFSRVNIYALLIATIIAIGSYSTFQENLIQKYKIELDNRGVIWQRTIELSTLTLPLFIRGWGHGQYALAFGGIAKQYFPDTHGAMGGPDKVWRRAHNEYVQVLFEQGAVGLICLFGFLLSLWLFGFDMQRESIIIAQLFAALNGICLIAIYSFPLRVASLGILIVVITASLEACRRDQYGIYS